MNCEKDEKTVLSEKARIEEREINVLKKLINVRSHIGWRGERSIPYKGVETSP